MQSAALPRSLLPKTPLRTEVVPHTALDLTYEEGDFYLVNLALPVLKVYVKWVKQTISANLPKYSLLPHKGNNRVEFKVEKGFKCLHRMNDMNSSEDVLKLSPEMLVTTAHCSLPGVIYCRSVPLVDVLVLKGLSNCKFPQICNFTFLLRGSKMSAMQYI